MQKNINISIEYRQLRRIGSDRSVRWLSHGWHMMALGSVLGVSAWASEAKACGATPDEVYPLLPAEGQQGVPLNAVLSIAASNTQGAVIELRQKRTEQLLDVVLDGCPGRVCMATPSALLENTEYEYRGVVEYQSEESVWTAFTTGTETSEADLDGTAVVAAVISADPKVPLKDESTYPCGYYRRAQIEFDVSSVSPPVAIVDGTNGPDFFSPPLVIADDESGTLEMSAAPDCFVPLMIDTLGNRVELDEVCLPGDEMSLGMGGSEPDSSQVTEAMTESSADESSEARDSGGCLIGSRGTPSGGAALWGLLGLGLFRLRRRAA